MKAIFTRMHGSGDLHEFAIVLGAAPEARREEWAPWVRAARPEPGMRMTVRTPSLLVFLVEVDAEFLAIGRADAWLQSLAAAARPPFTIRTNTQPAHEV